MKMRTIFAVLECREGVAAKAVVLKKADELTADLKKLGAELEKAKEELDKGGTKMKTEVRAEKEKQLQNRRGTCRAATLKAVGALSLTAPAVALVVYAVPLPLLRRGIRTSSSS